MSFLYPAFLIGALAVAIPVVLHLLRREVASEVGFTAVRLIERSPVARAKRRQPRDLLLLAARIAALLLLAAAFARPYLRGAASAGLSIVAIDRSYSMGGGDRFAAAIELARKAIDGASEGQVALIAFDDSAALLAGPGPQADAHAALARLQAGFGATRYDALFEKAAELAGPATPHLVIVGDLQESGWRDGSRPVVPSDWRVEVLDVAAATTNVAVTDLVTQDGGVRATVRNTGTTQSRGALRVAIDGRQVATAPFDVGPGVSQDVAAPIALPPAGALTVSLDDPGGLPGDDTRHLLLDGQPRRGVLIVTGPDTPGTYLARAFDSAADDQAALVPTRVAASGFSANAPATLETQALVVLLSTRGLERPGREAIRDFVTAGGGLLVALSDDIDPAVLASIVGGAELGRPAARAAPVTLAPTNRSHPIFQPFGPLAANLGQVRVDRRWPLPEQPWHVIARFSDGAPALVEREEGQGRMALFGSDLDRRANDFPLHPAFVPFTIEAAAHLARGGARALDYLVASAPAGVEPTPGVHRLDDGRTAVVNVDVRESTLATVQPAAFDGYIERSARTGVQAAGVAQAVRTEAGQGYWRYGLMLMLLALAAESFVGRS